MIENVDTFKYLGSMLSFDNINWPTVARKLQRGRRKWGWFSRMLCREGGYTRTSGRFYVAVVQYVLLFGSELWVFTPLILRVMGSFHNWVARSILVRIPQCKNDFLD